MQSSFQIPPLHYSDDNDEPSLAYSSSEKVMIFDNTFKTDVDQVITVTLHVQNIQGFAFKQYFYPSTNYSL